MNRIITIGREFGSGGRELGRRLADELGFEYYDYEILTKIVEQTDLSENYVNEIVEGNSHRAIPITVGHTMSVNFDYNIQRMQDIYRAQTTVIKDMAQKSDCVIVGRCADYILKDEDVKLYRIFVYADMESRIKRCIERATEGEDVSEKNMKRNIQRIDRKRAAYYEDYTLQKWADKSNYDFLVNTSNLDIAEVSRVLAKLFE